MKYLLSIYENEQKNMSMSPEEMGKRASAFFAAMQSGEAPADG